MFQQLNQTSQRIAHKTLSAYAFYYIVGDALLKKQPLSVVRMGDGEHDLMRDCVKAANEGYSQSIVDYRDEEWRTRLGIDGITYKELQRRLIFAATECSHFAPSVSGLSHTGYNVYQYFAEPSFYIDNFFVNIWSQEQKADLFKTAGRVLFIHRNISTADAIQINSKKLFGTKLTFIQLKDWRDTESVIERANQDDAPLVLFAGGPAGKYIAPIISRNNKVVLDLGNTTDHWTFSTYKA